MTLLHARKLGTTNHTRVRIVYCPPFRAEAHYDTRQISGSEVSMIFKESLRLELLHASLKRLLWFLFTGARRAKSSSDDAIGCFAHAVDRCFNKSA
jgi:hypothetical protein